MYKARLLAYGQADDNSCLKTSNSHVIQSGEVNVAALTQRPMETARQSLINALFLYTLLCHVSVTC